MSAHRRRRAAVLSAAAVFVAGCVGVNVASAVRYGAASIADPHRAPLADVPALSQNRIMSRLEALQRTKRPGIILSDASATTIGKLEESYSSPTPILFFADMGSGYSYNKLERGPFANVSFGSAAYRSRLRALIQRHTDLYQLRTFPGPGGGAFDRFLFDVRIEDAVAHPERLWLMTSPNPTLLNTWSAPKSFGVALVPWAKVHDYLAVVSSQRGSAGIFDRPRRRGTGIMLSRLEPDPLMRGGQIEAVGRNLLFDVINPSPTIRLVIDFTATLNADGVNQIPPVSVTGTRRTAFAVSGRGAARLFSPPLTARVVGGVPMLEVDMGTDGITFPDRKRTGLLALFGARYRLDPRRLVGFVRDISAVSEADFENTLAPSAIASFPAGLRDRGLQFSGFYEDGWVSERATASLRAPRRNDAAVVVRGSLPALSGVAESVIHVKIDGVEAVAQPILPGDFEVRADARGDGRRHAIEIAFDRAFRLPKGDDRIASAQLSYVGYE
ncbi:MAG TPA: hypothetical protein VE826_11295 [Dongiaceae bacterium]|nr:hypothetical protein [Dongiaceae bacterium]